MQEIHGDVEQARQAMAAYVEPIAELAMRICAVPSPSGAERERAEFVAAQFRERGYTPEIDAIGNVYVRRGNMPGKPVLMLLAHTDTVFPAGTPIPVRREGDTLYGPGIGDNSLSVATMITTFAILDALKITTPVDILAVANVGEEGLGNLRGARAAVERYRDQLGAVLVIDGRYGKIINAGVGSKRWRATVEGPGGHSWMNFGVPSAIHGLGRIIAAIADLSVPASPKTTFNVGVIEGGTSVNTIAASASAIIDMRSTDNAALDALAHEVRTIIEQAAGDGLTTTIETLGERPTGMRDRSDPLVRLAAETLAWLGVDAEYEAASTDANIPLSLGIPAICVGVSRGERGHTVHESVSVPPIRDGLVQLLRLYTDATALLSNE